MLVHKAGMRTSTGNTQSSTSPVTVARIVLPDENAIRSDTPNNKDAKQTIKTFLKQQHKRYSGGNGKSRGHRAGFEDRPDSGACCADRPDSGACGGADCGHFESCTPGGAGSSFRSKASSRSSGSARVGTPSSVDTLSEKG